MVSERDIEFVKRLRKSDIEKILLEILEKGLPKDKDYSLRIPVGTFGEADKAKRFLTTEASLNLNRIEIEGEPYISGRNVCFFII